MKELPRTHMKIDFVSLGDHAGTISLNCNKDGKSLPLLWEVNI